MFWINFTIKKEFVQLFISGYLGITMIEGKIWGCWAGFTRPTSPFLSHRHGDSQKKSFHYNLNAKIPAALEVYDRQRERQVVTAWIEAVRVFGLRQVWE